MLVLCCQAQRLPALPAASSAARGDVEALLSRLAAQAATGALLGDPTVRAMLARFQPGMAM